MYKMKKSLWLTLTTVLALSLTLAACGGSSGSNGNGSNAAAGGSAGESKDNAAAPAADAGKEGVTEMKLFVDFPWFPFKEWKGPVAEEITKRTGVRPVVTIATDDKQLPLMISSNDLPDLVFTQTNVQRMSAPNLSFSWNELIDKYAPDFKIDPVRIRMNTVADGKFYTVRDAFSTKEEFEKYPKAASSGPGLVIRQDIMDKLGNPPLKTMDDLVAVLKMVKEKYPDMVPLIFNPNPYWTKGYVFANFGINNDPGDQPFVDVNGDGTLVHQLHHPAIKDAYLFINRLYREGLIKPENFAWKNEQQADQLVYTGRAFAYAKQSTTADIAASNAQSKAYKFVQAPPLSDKFKLFDSSNGWAGVFITKNNKNPEKAIKFMQFLFSEEGQRLAYWGREGTDWTWNEAGYPEFKYNQNNDAEVQALGAQWWGRLSHSQVTENLNQYVPGSETAKANQALAPYHVTNNNLALVKPQPDSREKIIEDNLTTMIKNEEVKIYLANSEEDASNAFDSMLKKAEGIGLADLEKWANDQYKKVNAEQ